MSKPKWVHVLTLYSNKQKYKNNIYWTKIPALPGFYFMGTDIKKSRGCGIELHNKIFAQVNFLYHFVLDDFFGCAVFQDFAIV